VARRTKEDAAITREQLIDAAERVFRKRGLAGSTLAEVAAEAGVSRGALYWHFRDKSDLYAAMCERATLPLENMLEQAASIPHADPIGSLRDLAICALTRLARDARAQAVFDVMFHKSERTSEPATVAERERRERGHCLVQVERLLMQAVTKGQLPADTDTALATRALHAYMEGVMDQWVLDPSAFDLGSAAPALIDVMFGGLCAAPPRVSRANRAVPEASTKRPERALTAQTEPTADEA